MSESTFDHDLIASSANFPGTAPELRFLHKRKIWDTKGRCINKGPGQKEMWGAYLVLKRQGSCKE